MTSGQMESNALPLNEISVVELSQVLAGPFGTMQLGDLGAEVIKIETPNRGDRARKIEPIPEYFDVANRNKKSIEVDLKSEIGQEAVQSLLEDADVFVESTKPGRIDDYGLAYKDIREINPELIYCSISGFGSDSPYEDVPAWDLLIQAMSGVMSMTGEADGPPVWSGLSSGDIAASMYLAQSILAAILAREQGGLNGGDYIEVPMLDAAISWLTLRAGYVFGFDEPYPRGNHHPNLVPFGVYETADGLMVIAAATQSLWEDLCESIDRPDIRDDTRFESPPARVENRETLVEILNHVFREQSTDEWIERLHANEVPAAPVHDTKTVWEDEHVKQRDLHQTMPREELENADVIDNPVRFTNLTTTLRDAPPKLGSHTEKVFQDQGFSDKEIDRIRGE